MTNRKVFCKSGSWTKLVPIGNTEVVWLLLRNQRRHCRANIVLFTYTHTHTHPFNGPLSGTTRVSQYQKGKTKLDFTEARDSEWQWHQLGHMQVCTSIQTNNHASTPLLSFLQAGCPSCHPNNSVKALKAYVYIRSALFASMKCVCFSRNGCIFKFHYTA